NSASSRGASDQATARRPRRPQKLRPVVYQSVGSDLCRELLIQGDQHISKIVAGVGRQPSEKQSVNDHQFSAQYLSAVLGDLVELARLIDLLNQDMRLQIEHLVTALCSQGR